MPKKRRCLKAVLYIYLPKDEDLKSLKAMKYYAKNQPGRIQLFDSFGEKEAGKMVAFTDYGQMVAVIAKQYRKLSK